MAPLSGLVPITVGGMSTFACPRCSCPLSLAFSVVDIRQEIFAALVGCSACGWDEHLGAHPYTAPKEADHAGTDAPI